jgi:hypothetical protein
MTGLRVVDGTCGRGSGTYDRGVFAMPDGRSRGVETLTDLTVHGDPGGAPAWTDQVVKGLQGALKPTERLPRPLGLAASAIGAGLGLFDRAVRFTATFADGSTAAIEADAALPACIARDRDVVRGVAARAVIAPDPVQPEAEISPDPAPTAVFEYEKRNGRLRRVVAKPPPRA